jgi:hypothetical protein
MIRRIITLAAVVAIVAAVVESIPDVARYLEIREM